jgi:hypothetical protein
MKTGIARCKLVVLLPVISLLTSACATYSDHIQGVYLQLEQQHPAAALTELEKSPGPQRDRLAYLLNHAMLLRMNADYAGSNRDFEQAKILIDQFDAISLREQTGALTINETLRSYTGEPHEQVLLHLYAALNYLQLGELDSARVEALQVNLRLQQFSEDDDKNEGYNEDPFARYLTAMIYEELEEWSDAMIAYRDAYQAYLRYATRLNLAVPEFLQKDLLRLSKKMGLRDEWDNYHKTFGDINTPSVSDLKAQGELIFILHNGLAPMKKEHSSRVVDYGTGRLVSIALPYYVPSNYHAQHAAAIIEGRRQALQTVTNIDTVAQITLESRLPALTARAIARAVIKDNTARRVEEDKGLMAGLIVNIAAAATEVADTRSWWTLPHNIQVLRLPLSPGTYDLTIELRDDYAPLATLNFNDISISAGHKTYLERHWIKPIAPLPKTGGQK